MRKFILLLLVITAFGCSKDNNGDNTQTLSFGTFEKSKGVPIPPNWLQGKWDVVDCDKNNTGQISYPIDGNNRCIMDASKIQEPNGYLYAKDGNILFKKSENTFIFMESAYDVYKRLTQSSSIVDPGLVPDKNNFYYAEYVKVDENTIKMREGRIKEGDKECNCSKYIFFKKI